MPDANCCKMFKTNWVNSLFYMLCCVRIFAAPQPNPQELTFKESYWDIPSFSYHQDYVKSKAQLPESLHHHNNATMRLGK
mmetsp:Transcript_52632/g.87424  ORF Transcript_52632/g.87424 Transcript_52632/m.87424 type:complete len:80 (+) Transcript_52632:112-351(+)